MDRLQLHFVGPGQATYNLPPGSESFQLEIAPSGHMVLPVGEYEAADQALSATMARPPTVLHTDMQTDQRSVSTPETGGSSSSTPQQPSGSCGVPVDRVLNDPAWRSVFNAKFDCKGCKNSRPAWHASHTYGIGCPWKRPRTGESSSLKGAYVDAMFDSD